MAKRRKRVSTAPPSIKKDPEYYKQFFEEENLPEEFHEPVTEEYVPKQIIFPRPHKVDPRVYDVPIRDRRIGWKDAIVILFILSVPAVLAAYSHWPTVVSTVKGFINGSL